MTIALSPSVKISFHHTTGTAQAQTETPPENGRRLCSIMEDDRYLIVTVSIGLEAGAVLAAVGTVLLFSALLVFSAASVDSEGLASLAEALSFGFKDS